jgi:hypothetical protein
MKVNFSFVYLNLREIAGYELRVTNTAGMQSDDIFIYKLIDCVVGNYHAPRKLLWEDLLLR